MPNLRGSEWLIIILLIVLLFGAKRLPEAARSMGRSLRIFKAETKGLVDDGEPSAPPAQAAAQATSAPIAPPAPSAPPTPVPPATSAAPAPQAEPQPGSAPTPQPPAHA